MNQVLHVRYRYIILGVPGCHDVQVQRKRSDQYSLDTELYRYVCTRYSMVWYEYQCAGTEREVPHNMKAHLMAIIIVS